MRDDAPPRRRVVLDEMLPRLLAGDLPGHDVTTVAEAGWAGVLNGELLRRMDAGGIDVFVTADRRMEHQQRLAGRRFGVVVLAAGGTGSTTCGRWSASFASRSRRSHVAR